MFSILNKLTGRSTPAAEVEAPVGSPAAAAVSPAAASGSATDPIAAVLPPPDLNVDALVAPSTTAAAPPAFGPVDAARTEALHEAIVAAISTVFDPEIPVNIYELGLIYKIEADAESRVHVDMTLTSPACPSAQQLPSELRYKVKAVAGVTECTVEVVWEPPWTKEMMSETAKLTLGMF
jgi:FeS assembly SUF system protein